MASKKKSSFWPVFGMPLLIAFLGAAGLFAALLGDGWWDALAWVGLAVPAVLGLRGLVAR
ncbi:hypothetical protein NVV94_24665 [Pseudomonas sp. LS1212]|uniref:hypothetical protein n=1 Tax=Pseudomonas sp. LS1212 TaxID=2972478 RepID=UPI00215BACDE|nr:hypothetical protein [Pseudomonas sp. LS1212]UVJ43684.1 hypothetical protein NVV94_24665 [Pseudomonas sp. LS1212]